MTLQTFTIREAETQLHDLVKQAQATHQPVILTSEETTAPVVVLLEPDQYAATITNTKEILAVRLNKLEALLDLLTAQWDVANIRQAFPSALRWYLEGVWEASQHRELPFRQLVVILQMAAQGLQMTEFTHTHLTLCRQCLQILHQATVSQDDFAQCDDALIEQGFPVLLNFDEEMVALYVDES